MYSIQSSMNMVVYFWYKILYISQGTMMINFNCQLYTLWNHLGR